MDNEHTVSVMVSYRHGGYEERMKTTTLTRVPIEGDSLIEGTMTHQLFFVPVCVTTSYSYK